MIDRYLTLADIAEAAGITVPAARQAHKRAAANRAAGKPSPVDLPVEDVRLGLTPGWKPATVAAWIDERKNDD